METVMERLLKAKVVAIVRGVDAKDIIPTAQALIDGGVTALEVTFDQTSPATIENTLTSIRKLNETFGDTICLGAGTVIKPEQVRQAAEAGAKYMISPNTNVNVIKATKELGLISIPGAMTPSEAVEGYEAGADIIKLFPAGLFGPGYIKAVRGPLSYMKFFAVGGINENNAADFFAAGACGVGVGGNLVSVKAIRAGNFEALTETAKLFMKNLANV